MSLMLAIIALFVVWAVAAAYSYHVYTRWVAAKDAHVNAAKDANASESVAARLVSQTSARANDALVGHARDYRDVVQGLRDDHDRVMRTMEVLEEEVRDEEFSLVASVREDEEDVIRGTNITKKVERELTRDWPQYVASYMDGWASLDHFRRNGLGVSDTQVMTATDFRAGDVSLVNLRSAVVANVAQYEIDEDEHERNARRLGDIASMAASARAEIQARQTAADGALSAARAALTSDLARFTSERIEAEAATIRGSFSAGVAGFQDAAVTDLRRAASVGMGRVVATAASNLRLAEIELDALVEQSDFNAKLLEIEGRTSESKARLTNAANATIRGLSVGVSERVARDGETARVAAERMDAIQRQLEDKYANLLPRSNVISYLQTKDRAFAESLFQVENAAAVLAAGSVAVTGGSNVPQVAVFARQLDDLQAHRLDSVNRLALGQDFLQVGGAAKIGAVGDALDVGGGLPVVFTSDPWIAGENRRLLEKAQSLAETSARSLRKSQVSAMVAQYAPIGHNHTHLLHSSALNVSLPADLRLASVDMLADEALPPAAVASLDLACLRAVDLQALAAANVRVGTGISIGPSTFTGPFFGDRRVGLSSFQGLVNDVFPSGIAAPVADSTWVDMSGCSNGHFSNVSVPSSSFTSVRADVATINAVTTVALGGSNFEIVRRR